MITKSSTRFWLASLALPAMACGSSSSGDGLSRVDDAGAGGGASEAATDGPWESDRTGMSPDASTGTEGDVQTDAAIGARDGAKQDVAMTDVLVTGDSENADPCGPTNPAVVPLPVTGTTPLSVASYGAKGDGTTDDTSALQAALDAAGTAGGGVVSVPAGTFLSGPIVIHDATRLELAAGAVLEMLPMSQWPGTTPFITAEAAHDIALTGSGTIEGQGQAWWNALTASPALVRPQEVSFSGSARVLISGIRLQNSPEEHIWVKGDTDVTIVGITIETLAASGQHAPNNTDGVDISANGVFLCNDAIACGDDNVVMEGSHIYVGYSSFGVGHGCTIGSITSGGVSDVTVDQVTMTGTTAGIRMKSARGRGGLVTNLSYSNMTMTNVTSPIAIESYYPTLPTDPTADPAQPVTSMTPEWQDITIKNLQSTGSPNAGTLWGLPEAKISNVVLDSVSISANTGMDVFHATGISFIGGSSITVTSGPAVIVYDAAVTGIATHTYP